MTLIHGGNVAVAAQRFNIPRDQWTDLSTGISPWSWPVPSPPLSVWQNLPEADGELERIAAIYYGCDPMTLVAVPGSQYALQHVPLYLTKGRVAIPQRGYAEHRAAWQSAGHEVVEYRDTDALQKLVHDIGVEHAVLINPNNPTAETLQRANIIELHRALHARGGFLVVDEAFADSQPEISVAGMSGVDGLIVFRSLGKYFGLAGVRLGFMLAPAGLCSTVLQRMPPWSLSHPARWIGAAAMKDCEWQREQAQRLSLASTNWQQDLAPLMPGLIFARSSLFVTGSGEHTYCEALHNALGRRGILVRLFDPIEDQGMLRFGLPHTDVRERVISKFKKAVREVTCAIG